MKFKFIEHTADIGIEAYGETWEEAFENAALGMFEIMTDTKKIGTKKKMEIMASGEDMKSLLYDFLEQFLILHDSENLVFSKVKIIELNNNKLKAEVWGEEFNPDKHEDRTSVKAITYHQMEIIEKDSKKTIRFIVDI